MSVLSISESNLINSILNNPEEDFHKIVGLIEKKIIGKFDGKIWIEDKVDGDYTQGSNIMILVKAAHHTVRKDIKNGIPLTDHR